MSLGSRLKILSFFQLAAGLGDVDKINMAIIVKGQLRAKTFTSVLLFTIVIVLLDQNSSVS